VRGGLVVAQVALSVILLTGSGLLIRSLVQLQAVDLGFPTEDVITATVSLDPAAYEDPASRTRFFQTLAEDVKAIPGVESASFVNKIPIRDRWTNWYIWDAGSPPETPEDRLSTYSRTVMPGYFEAMGVPFLLGRDHRLDDDARDEPYLIINQTAAAALFFEQDPIGRRITVFNGIGEDNYEILGVVADFRVTSVDRTPSPQMYYNHSTLPSTVMHLVVRAQGDSGALVSAIRRAVLDRDPDVPIESVTAMGEVVSSSLSTTRLLSVATALFAITALLLSFTGLHAVLAFYVGQRTREIGIRVAFGATSGRVSRMVLKRGLAMVSGGLILGLLGAGAGARLLQSQLYQVGAVDPVTFGSVAMGFAVIGVLAALLPARRAVSVDPVRTMQVE
jgi:predicted permease